jgi:3-oxoacyl-(acyl-carrier-protein) synthase
MNDPITVPVYQKRTSQFCVDDPFLNKHQQIVNITEVLNNALQDVGINIKYINVANADMLSTLYNPDGKLGHFCITIHEPTPHHPS